MVSDPSGGAVPGPSRQGLSGDRLVAMSSARLAGGRELNSRAFYKAPLLWIPIGGGLCKAIPPYWKIRVCWRFVLSQPFGFVLAVPLVSTRIYFARLRDVDIGFD